MFFQTRGVMGAAGRAIGPDGKPLKNKEEKVNKPKGSGVQRRNEGAGGGKSNRNKEGGGKHGNKGSNRGSNTSGNRVNGPRPLMSQGLAGPPIRAAPRGGPMGGSHMIEPMGRGHQPFEYPMHRMGLFGQSSVQPSGPDPSGSYGSFFGAKMNDSGSGTAPPASLLNQRATEQHKSPSVPPVPAISEHVGEVPGFGTNSNIHELFGKMVWKKMEQLRDEQVVDNLQTQIMKLIHDSLAAQNMPGPSSTRIELNRGAFLQPSRRY